MNRAVGENSAHNFKSDANVEIFTDMHRCTFLWLINVLDLSSSCT
jgi:hypothetical protein